MTAAAITAAGDVFTCTGPPAREQAERHLKKHRAQWQPVVRWLDMQLAPPSYGISSRSVQMYHSSSSNDEADRHTFMRTISACSTLERAKEVLVRALQRSLAGLMTLKMGVLSLVSVACV